MNEPSAHERRSEKTSGRRLFERSTETEDGRTVAGLTPERREARFAADLNGQLEELLEGFAATVLADFEAGGYVHRLLNGSFEATAKARDQLAEFWALEAA